MKLPRTRFQLGILAAVGIGVIGCVLLFVTKAATPATSVGPEAGTVTAPAVVVNDSTASNGRAVEFVPAASSGTGSGGTSTSFPDATTTGPRVSSLTTITVGMSGTGWNAGSGSYGTALYITGPNVHLTGYYIPFTVEVLAGGTNAVISDSDIRSTNSGAQGRVIDDHSSGLQLLYDIVEGPQSPAGNTGYQVATDSWVEYGLFDATGNYGALPTIDHSEFRYINHPLNITSGTVTENYMHNLSNSGDGSQHSDILFCGGGDTKQLTIRHNTLINDRKDATAAVVLLSNAFGTQENVTMDNNLMAGGAFSIYGGGAAGSGYSAGNHIVITNNKFSTQVYVNGGSYGPLNNMPTSGSNVNVVSGNTWYDGPNAGKAVN